MGHDFSGRCQRAAAVLADLAGDVGTVLLVSKLDHVRYLTGFTGSNAALLIGRNRILLATDSRYSSQVRAECPDLPAVLVPAGNTLPGALFENARNVHGWAWDSVGVEGAHITLDAFDLLRESLPSETRIRSFNGAVEAVKAIKEPVEIDAIREACRLADAACEKLLEYVRPGRRESDVAWDLEVWLQTHGARKLGFETIVASGPRSAVVHGRASGRVIGSSGKPEFVLIDFGCELDGYCSDITRTFVVGGEPDMEQRGMYEAVREAEAAAVLAVGPGVPGNDIDALARRILRKHGFPDMPHNTGHGLGMLVHDQVRVLAPSSTVTLKPNMVLTVEPGAYVDGFGGVRIEDDVLVTETGRESLTLFPRDLMVIR